MPTDLTPQPQVRFKSLIRAPSVNFSTVTPHLPDRWVSRPKLCLLLHLFPPSLKASAKIRVPRASFHVSSHKSVIPSSDSLWDGEKCNMQLLYVYLPLQLCQAVNFRRCHGDCKCARSTRKEGTSLRRPQKCQAKFFSSWLILTFSPSIVLSLLSLSLSLSLCPFSLPLLSPFP